MDRLLLMLLARFDVFAHDVGAWLANEEPPPTRDLDALDSEFRSRAEPFLEAAEAAGTPLEVDETYRTPIRQAWLYAQGRDGDQVVDPSRVVTNAKPGHSRHELGVAIDTFPKGVPRSDNARAVAALNALAPIAATFGLKNLNRQRDGIDDPGHWQDAA